MTICPFFGDQPFWARRVVDLGIGPGPLDRKHLNVGQFAAALTAMDDAGTVAGLARVLRRERPETGILLSEPANAQLLGSGEQQVRGPGGAPAASHPAFTPHPIQGWTPDFIPLVLQEAVDAKGYDEVIPIAGPQAIEWARKLAQKEGILSGISGGASFGVAHQVAERAEPGSVILCILPDTGERYLSTPLFEAIETEMSQEELALSLSTPGYQLETA